MKVVVLKRIIDLLETYVKRIIDFGNAHDVAEIPEVMEESVLAIKCNYKGNNLGALTPCFEECDKLLLIMKDDISNIASYSSQIIIILKKISDIIEENAKYEALFLPYKVSMWDSFDSVYHAALKSEKWKVTVVPIPYYNIDSNRNLLSEEYEGKHFPKEVHITDYKDYEIEKEQPDVIFIHNPYDEYNRVTQVYPDYYSSNLKKYCKNIVYIPYFINVGKMSSNQCLMPGPQNAWRIIAQNELIRQQYICEGGINGDKVLALGSPKFDRVIEKMVECKLPKAWEVLRGKKIFFLNTHLEKIISQAMSFLERMDIIIEAFKKDGSIALIWRPHPLSIQTAKSLNPQFLQTYLQTIERFKAAKIGVYDETPEVETAIAIADAYIGEIQSSVSQLFEITKKPMFYINGYSAESEQVQRNWKFWCGGYVNTCIYMYSYDNNNIVKVNTKTGQTEIISNPIYISGDVRGLFTAAGVYNEYIFFLPGAANVILKYNSKTNESKVIELDEEQYDYDYDAVVFNKYLYIFPLHYKTKVLCINLDTDEVTFLDYKLPNDFSKINGGLYNGSIVIKNSVYRGSWLLPHIQKYNLDTGVITNIKINGYDGSVFDLDYDGKNFWILTGEQNAVFCWNREQNKILHWMDLAKNNGSQNMLYAKILICHDHIYLTPVNSPYIVTINLSDNRMKYLNCEEIEGFNLVLTNDDQPFADSICQDEDGALYLLPFQANGIVKIDKDDTLSFLNTELLTKDILEKQTDSQIFDDSMCSIGEFIECVKQRERKYEMEELELVGSKIWEHIRQEIEEGTI